MMSENALLYACIYINRKKKTRNLNLCLGLSVKEVKRTSILFVFFSKAVCRGEKSHRLAAVQSQKAFFVTKLQTALRIIPEILLVFIKGSERNFQ